MWARGSELRPGAALNRGFTRGSAGFTLIELLLVVAIVGMATGLVTLAIRDPQATRLEQEAARLVTLLETARAESRTSGVAVNWVPVRMGDAPGTQAEAKADAKADFRFVGLANTIRLPNRWLDPQTSAEVLGANRVLNLGPEPILAPQRLVLRLGNRRMELGTDGLAPFAVISSEAAR